MTEGQELSESLSFARIPAKVFELNLAMIRRLKWQGEPIGAERAAAAGY
jgi:phosphate transport system substrate-binding protein